MILWKLHYSELKRKASFMNETYECENCGIEFLQERRPAVIILGEPCGRKWCSDECFEASSEDYWIALYETVLS